jgi:signal transduction histidine kinase
LSLVKAIVQAHGGQVEVASVPNQGSDFTIILPAAVERPTQKLSD